MKCVATVTSEGVNITITTANGTHTASLGVDGWDNPEVASLIGERTDLCDLQSVLEDYAVCACDETEDNDPPTE